MVARVLSTTALDSAVAARTLRARAITWDISERGATRQRQQFHVTSPRSAERVPSKCQSLCQTKEMSLHVQRNQLFC